jgi:hypothetical protein
MASYPHTDFIPGLPPALLIPQPKKAAPVPATPKARKKLIRRTDHDYSQPLRRGFQIAFLLMNVWIGGTFYFWVRQFEPGGQLNSLSRPAGVEGWLPIAGMMNLKYLVLTRQVPALHPAALFLLVTFASIAFLFRKAFCSWLCPVGTISEYLWQLGKKIFRRNFRINRWVDIPLRGLKYLLLGFFVWAVSSMTPPDIVAFMRSPYGVIADVKMLNFFRFLGITGAIVLGILVVASILVQNFWCRYLCPYGALLGLTSFFSPVRIRRNEDACIDCAKCAKACPSALPVDKLVTIKSAPRKVRCRCRSRHLHLVPSRLSDGLPRPSVTVPSPLGRWPLELPFYFSELLDLRKLQATGRAMFPAPSMNRSCLTPMRLDTLCPETDLPPALRARTLMSALSFH